jgi:hypothetical protein
LAVDGGDLGSELSGEVVDVGQVGQVAEELGVGRGGGREVGGDGGQLGVAEVEGAEGADDLDAGGGEGVEEDVGGGEEELAADAGGGAEGVAQLLADVDAEFVTLDAAEEVAEDELEGDLLEVG